MRPDDSATLTDDEIVTRGVASAPSGSTQDTTDTGDDTGDTSDTTDTGDDSGDTTDTTDTGDDAGDAADGTGVIP